MKFAANQDELEKMLQPRIDRAVQYTIDKMLETLQRHILEDVYFYDYYPNKHYAYGTGFATMDFYNAFKRTAGKKIKGGKEQSIIYFYKSMSTNKRHGVHVGGSGVDVRRELAEFLNTDGKVAHKERNYYWDNFIDAVNANFVRWFEEGFKL